MLIFHRYILFHDVLIHISCLFPIGQFVFLLLIINYSFYILDTNHLSVIYFTNIFSVGGLSSYSLNSIFHKADAFNFNRV